MYPRCEGQSDRHLLDSHGRTPAPNDSPATGNFCLGRRGCSRAPPHPLPLLSSLKCVILSLLPAPLLFYLHRPWDCLRGSPEAADREIGDRHVQGDLKLGRFQLMSCLPGPRAHCRCQLESRGLMATSACLPLIHRLHVLTTAHLKLFTLCSLITSVQLSVKLRTEQAFPAFAGCWGPVCTDSDRD